MTIINSFIFSYYFILVKVVVDPQPTLVARWTVGGNWKTARKPMQTWGEQAKFYTNTNLSWAQDQTLDPSDMRQQCYPLHHLLTLLQEIQNSRFLFVTQGPKGSVWWTYCICVESLTALGKKFLECFPSLDGTCVLSIYLSVYLSVFVSIYLPHCSQEWC